MAAPAQDSGELPRRHNLSLSRNNLSHRSNNHRRPSSLRLNRHLRLNHSNRRSNSLDIKRLSAYGNGSNTIRG